MLSPNVLTPRQVFEKFLVERKITRIDEVGNQRVTYEPAGSLCGVISACQPSETERFKGTKHPVTRKIVQILGGMRVQIGDKLVKNNAAYLVEFVEDCAGLGKYFVIFVSERSDLR